MRLKRLTVPSLVTLALSVPQDGAAQELARGDPNKLRDPTMLSLTASENLRGPVQLLLGEFLRAASANDQANLARFDAEQIGWASASCTALTSATFVERPIVPRDSRPSRPRRFGTGEPPDMSWGQIEVTAGRGDTLAFAVVPVTRRGLQGKTTEEMTFAVVEDKGAIRIARVVGPATSCGGTNQ
jgi:hypothetical protein